MYVCACARACVCMCSRFSETEAMNLNCFDSSDVKLDGFFFLLSILFLFFFPSLFFFFFFISCLGVLFDEYGG